MKRILTTTDIILFSIVSAVLAVLIKGYSYGTQNQIEQLPLILRALNKSFIKNDFYVNADSGFGPHFFYVRFVTFFAHILSVPYAFFFLTLMTNIAVALVTTYFGRQIFFQIKGTKNSFQQANKAGLLACITVMSLASIQLGAASMLTLPQIIPQTIAMPFALLSVLLGIRKKIIFSMLCAGISSLLHPLVGAETGIIVLAAAWIYAIFCFLKKRNKSLISLKSLFLATGILIVFCSIWLVPYAATDKITTRQYIYILAYFRNPHHYIPSIWPKYYYAEFFSFLLALSIAWYWWKNVYVDNNKQSITLGLIIFITLMFFLGGYIFVEVIPLRIWVTAQPFREVFLIKWIGLTYISGIVAHFLFVNTKEKENHVWGYTSLIGLLVPITTAYVFIPKFLSETRWLRKKSYVIFFSAGPILLCLILFLLHGINPLEPRDDLLFFMEFIILLFFIGTSMKIGRSAILIGCLGLYMLVSMPNQILTRVHLSFLSRFKPQIVLSDLSGDDILAARYAKLHTEKNAIFLTPPNEGQFRLQADRAILVDVKAFPLDIYTFEWYARIQNAYGGKTLADLDIDYHFITDRKLLFLQSRYNISYALLYAITPTNLPVIYANKEYKLVSVVR